jgi:nucleotide-binding universal stress UspA family protein
MAKKYSNILVPFDGSKYSQRALDEAIEISKNFGSKLYVVMAVTSPVIEPPGMFVGMIRGVSMEKALDQYVDIASERAEHILQETIEYCRKKGVLANCQVISDKPGKAILDFSKRKDIDLIVMGSKGLRGIEKIKVLGSVSRHVLENANCPVMIVH